MTAYLKCYYPTEFMAALLTISAGKKDKDGNPRNNKYLREAESMGIRVLPPHINESQVGWTPIQGGAIRYGIGSIQGIGDCADHLIACQPYDSVQALIEKTDSKQVNKSKIEALIKSGCFDWLDSNRNAMYYQYIKSRGDDTTDIPVKTSKAQVIAMEKEYLGTSISVKSRWETIEDGKAGVQFTGIAKVVSPFKAKGNGSEHCRLTLETQEDEVPVLIFNRTWMPIKAQVMPGLKYTIVGKKNGDTFIADRIQIHEIEPTVSA